MNQRCLGIYIHIPFCKRKCAYCDFLSFSVSESEIKGVLQRYVGALCEHIGSYGSTEGYVIDSIFIGGGTPSLLSPEMTAKIIGAVKSRFRVAKDAEITMESNPGTASAADLRGFKGAGVNRLSIGVQSLKDDTLHLLGRIHTGRQALEFYNSARDAGFDNVNIDLMFAVPGMGLGQWRDELRQITALGPEHISFYSLEIEQGTGLFRMAEEGKVKRTDHATDRRMYGAALEILGAAGYEHYEISNAARPTRACRHNLKYWSMQEYLAFGPGGHSYIRPQKSGMTGIDRMLKRTGVTGESGEPEISSRFGVRFSNTTDLGEYIAYWSGEKSGREGRRFHTNRDEETTIDLNTLADERFLHAPFCEFHQNSEQDEISEYIFTGLRKIKGIELSSFQERFCKDITKIYVNEIKMLTEQNLIETCGSHLRLTRRGIDISNQVFIKFI